MASIYLPRYLAWNDYDHHLCDHESNPPTAPSISDIRQVYATKDWTTKTNKQTIVWMPSLLVIPSLPVLPSLLVLPISRRSILRCIIPIIECARRRFHEREKRITPCRTMRAPGPSSGAVVYRLAFWFSRSRPCRGRPCRNHPCRRRGRRYHHLLTAGTWSPLSRRRPQGTIRGALSSHRPRSPRSSSWNLT